MPKIIPDVSSSDKNGLDKYSQLFGEYFCLNNYEITYIKTLFNAFKQSCSGEFISQFMFLDFINVENVPMFSKLIKVGDECIMDWNHFFRFIMFTAFSPTVAYFYFLVCSFSEMKADVTFPDVLLLLSFLNKGIKIDEQEQIKKIFKRSDINEDGHINLNQFFNFVENSQNYWEIIFKFKTNVVNTFFQHNSYLDILQRKLKIEDIKDYQTTHNGKFPKSNCGSSFKSCMFGTPNPYEYDYESKAGMISFDSLVNIQIKTYKPFFEPPKKKETFQIKHLYQFSRHKVVNVIDKYYIEFRCISPDKIKNLEERRKNTISSSNNNLVELAATSSRNSRKPSILRSAVRSRRNTTDNRLSGSNGHKLASSCVIKRKSVPDLVAAVGIPCFPQQQQPIVFETPIALRFGSSSVVVTESVMEVPE